MKKKSLIPELAIVAVESYDTGPIIVKEFYDPDVKPIKSTGLSIDDKPVYKDVYGHI